jgi:hypothetical protein
MDSLMNLTEHLPPSKNWYLYELSAFPSSALESIDAAAKVMATIHMGKERPAMKKFSDLSLTKKIVKTPIAKEMAIEIPTAMPYPTPGLGIGSGQGIPQICSWQQEPSGGPSRPPVIALSISEEDGKHTSWASERAAQATRSIQWRNMIITYGPLPERLKRPSKEK